MARGFESKSVESQQTPELGSPADKRTGDQLHDARRREALEMSRRRIVKELEASRSEVHRAALQNALAHLDDELKQS